MRHVSDELHDELRDLGATPLEAAAVIEELAGLTSLAAVAPAPSADLAAVFGESSPTSEGLAAVARPSFGARARRRARRSTAVSGALVLALSGVGATGISAAANSLPAPIQQRFSEFSRSYLPFQFPQPHLRSVPGPNAQGDAGERRTAVRERQAPLRPVEPAPEPQPSSASATEASSTEAGSAPGSGADVVPGGAPDAGPQAPAGPADREARPSRSSAAASSPRPGKSAPAPAQAAKPRSGSAAAPTAGPTTQPPPTTESDPPTPPAATPEYGRPTVGITAGAPPPPMPGEPWQPAPDPTSSPTQPPPKLVASPRPPPVSPPEPELDRGTDEPDAAPEVPPPLPVVEPADPTEDVAP